MQMFIVKYRSCHKLMNPQAVHFSFCGSLATLNSAVNNQKVTTIYKYISK